MSEAYSPVKRALLEIDRLQRELERAKRGGNEPIAIVGLSCRFPGGVCDPDEFWRLLIEEREGITEIPPERWNVDAYYHPDPERAGAIATRWGGFLRDIDRFDAGFFGISPGEAGSMDPQQRLFLEVVWEALEHAAMPFERLWGSDTAVFVGVYPSDYERLHFASPEAIDVYSGTGTLPSVIAGRVAYLCNFTGPAVVLDTACSSSLVALHLACQSLRAGECGTAVAGGVNLILAPTPSMCTSRMGMLAADGRCKTFDARADGVVRSEGCGAVVLRRLADALASGDPVLAVIRGSAVNQDGRSNGLTAPNIQSQEAVLRQALANSGVQPGEVDFVETHGAGTALGDPAEVEALAAVYGRTAGEPCVLGAVKTNIGHTEAAAGMAGLIKAVLALERQAIPGNLNLARVNANLSLQGTRLQLARGLRSWSRGTRPRYAGVSSFGLSGTNAHVVLEEAPPGAHSGPSRPCHLLVLSAKSGAALESVAARLGEFIQSHPEIRLADIAWTLAVGRHSFEYRRALVCRDRVDAIRSLSSPDANLPTPEPVCSSRAMKFLFPDSAECEWRELYSTEPEFRAAVDRCRAEAGACAPPGAFLLQYGMAAVLKKWGIDPCAVSGVGSGEFMAAWMAGVMALEDAVLLAAGARPTHTFSLHAPRIPCFLSRAGGEVSPAQATDPAFWLDGSPAARMLRLPAQRGGDLWLEVGPSGTEPRMDSLLRTLGRLWVAGVPIDWPGVYASEQRRRVSLPAYPFERQRYWRELAKDSEPLRVADMDAWFYVPSWKRTVFEPAAQLRPRVFLFFSDAYGVGMRLAERLTASGCIVITVAPGNEYRRTDACSYTVRPACRQDYERLITGLEEAGNGPDRIVYAWLIGEQENKDLNYDSMLALTQALGDSRTMPCHLTVLSTGVQDVEAGDRLIPWKVAVLGLCRVVPQEYTGFRCRSVDVVLPVSASGYTLLAEQLERELVSDAVANIVALRGPHRWVEAFEPVKIPRAGSASRLRRGGVYLITGGLGGIGLAMAEHLGSTYEARLALVGRRGLPRREQWSSFLEGEDRNSEVARRIAAVQSLEARGNQVLVIAADVASPAQIASAVARTAEHFGPINGVLHAAGLPGDGLIALRESGSAARVLAPKIQGTEALAQALEGMPLDFFVLFSSVASAAGGLGQADYSAANNFLEAYARRHGHQFHTVAISWCEWLWNAWGEGLASLPEDVRTALTAHRRRFGLSFEEGAEVLERVLASGLAHVYVAPYDLNRRLAERHDARPGSSRPSRARPEITASFIEPSNELDRRIAAVWQDVLGVAPVGLDDNFFELGGNSLLGMDLIMRLRRSLGGTVPVQLLYQAPTVRRLGAYINGGGSASQRGEEWEVRASKRRERLLQMKPRRPSDGNA